MARPTNEERKAKKKAEAEAKKYGDDTTTPKKEKPLKIEKEATETPIQEDVVEEVPRASSYNKNRVVEDDIPQEEGESKKIDTEKTDSDTIKVSDDDVPETDYNPLELPPKAMIRDEIPDQPTPQQPSTGGTPPIDGGAGNISHPYNPSNPNPSSGSGKSEIPKKPVGEAVKRSAAEKSAMAYVGLYCQAKEGIMPEFAKIDEKKLLKLHRAGEINLNKSIATEQGDITIINFVRERNTIADTAFKTQPEVKQELTEALTDVLMEQGAVLTPTQRLLFTVGMDVIGAGVVAYKLKSSMNEFIKDMREEFANERSRPRPITVPNQSNDESEAQKKEEKPVEEKPTMESVIATAENEGREDDVIEEVEKPKKRVYNKKAK